MARLITPLVPKQIDSAKPKDKPYILFDGGGLYLEVTPLGYKFWRIQMFHWNRFVRNRIKRAN